jgi:hypothetical protein
MASSSANSCSKNAHRTSAIHSSSWVVTCVWAMIRTDLQCLHIHRGRVHGQLGRYLSLGNDSHRPSVFAHTSWRQRGCDRVHGQYVGLSSGINGSTNRTCLQCLHVHRWRHTVRVVGHPRGVVLITRMLTSCRAGVGSNSSLECKILFKNELRTWLLLLPSA